MGGWMTYQRVRNRNGLLPRKDAADPDPYPRSESRFEFQTLIGDLNRMERDYLTPEYPSAPFATRPAGSDPASEVARATGVDVDTVRKVLRAVFIEMP